MKRVSILIVSLLAAVSCAEQLQEGTSFPTVEGAVMTKVINSPAEYVEGSLLVYLSSEAADAFVSGEMDLAGELSEKVSLEYLHPVFRISPEKEAVARKHGLHRWFTVGFEGDTQETAARLTTFDAVSKVQYNQVMKSSSDGHAVPYSASVKSDDVLPFNDPYLADQWHYINTGSPKVSASAVAGADIAVKDAWTLTAGDPSVIVAIIDGPVQYDHPDLAANMWKNTKEVPGNGKDDDNNGYVDDIYGWNCVTCSPQSWEGWENGRKKSDFVYTNGAINWSPSIEGMSGHGTHVAGIVGAVNGNGTGVCGVAGGTGNGDGVRLMSCQIFQGKNTGTTQTTAIAFQYAADNGACIAQCSFGYENATFSSDSDFEVQYGAEYAAIHYFMDPANANSDVIDANIVIAAAGNSAIAQSSYPAAIGKVISVTGLGPDFLPAAEYTQYGAGCNIAAPGGDIWVGDMDGLGSELYTNTSAVLSTFISTVKDKYLKPDSKGEYAYMNGTSMACPHVSGVAALGLSYARKLGKKFTRDEFVSMLLTSVNEIDHLLIDNKTKPNGWNTTADLGKYRGKMGTGAVDAWRLLMAVEGTPSITVQVGDGSKAKRYDITSYFGDSVTEMTFLGVECDEATKASMGLVDDPEIKYGKLSINPTKVGSGKIKVRAIAGGDVIGGSENVGGMEIYRTISVMSRGVVSDNGGWL